MITLVRQLTQTVTHVIGQSLLTQMMEDGSIF